MENKTLRIKPRYYRRYTDPGAERLEKNFRHVYMEWDIPLGDIALLCVDVWDQDSPADMRRRDEEVTITKIVPLVKAAREKGLQVIHAPAPHIAVRSKSWVNLLKGKKDTAQAAAWPPAEIKEKYARPPEPQMEEALRIEFNETFFHKDVQPIKDEPVIATGEELHQWCSQKKIYHLVYAGFHTPGCMIGRSYGLVEMKKRGYSCLLLRDCTNGFETHETYDSQTCMKGTIAYLEQTGIYTLVSEELIKSLK